MICSISLVTKTLFFLTVALIYQFARAGDSQPGLLGDKASFSEATDRLARLLDTRIQEEEMKLAKLNNLRKTLISIATRFRNAQEAILQSADQGIVMHPTHSFIIISHLVDVVEELYSPLNHEDHDEESLKKLSSELNNLESKFGLPDFFSRMRYGQAILRLQTFYGLSIDDLAKGNILNDKNDADSNTEPDSGLYMGARECFHLGKIAHETENNGLAIGWFQKSLQLVNESDLIKSWGDNDEYMMYYYPSDELSINTILDYLAFAAYRNGQISYAAEVTKQWLAREPRHERALENLEYFEDELADTNFMTNQVEPSNTRIKDHISEQSNVDLYSPDREFSTDGYQLDQDTALRNLCLRGHEVSELSCFTKLSFQSYFSGPLLKIETLNEKPHIVRIHDIITEQEAMYLRKKAQPKLKRSTIQSKLGDITSDFRIAQTAWLSGDCDSVVKRVEHRIEEITGLDLRESEELQVVNYEIGGYYGPHLDASRPTNVDNDNTSAIAKHKNDRLATVLIYLNKVVAGGSTAFPRLNLSVLPIENSAVIWYNIKRNGNVDNKTLHSGCPVLLGLKWVATSWPREKTNSFMRPCDLTRQED